MSESSDSSSSWGDSDEPDEPMNPLTDLKWTHSHQSEKPVSINRRYDLKVVGKTLVSMHMRQLFDAGTSDFIDASKRVFSVTVPDTVTSVGPHAFRRCKPGSFCRGGLAYTTG